MDGGLSTLRQECAEQGLDYEETVHQRAAEVRLFKELDLALPDWAGALNATQASKPDDDPQPA